MPKPLEYFEKLYKYAPIVSAGASALGSDWTRSLGGWLSGETYTGNEGRGFQYEDTNESRYTDRGVGGAFGGFEGTARNYLTDKGYSWAGNLLGDTINLAGEILSTPIELGFRARDEVQGFLGANPGVDRIRKSIGAALGAYADIQGDGKGGGNDDDKEKRKRITHKNIPYGTPAQMRRLANARRIEEQNKRYGGVYDPKVAQLIKYAMMELDPTTSEAIRSRKTMGPISMRGQSIGRGKGIG